jgi:hypothetical protein
LNVIRPTHIAYLLSQSSFESQSRVSRLIKLPWRKKLL